MKESESKPALVEKLVKLMQEQPTRLDAAEAALPKEVTTMAARPQSTELCSTRRRKRKAPSGDEDEDEVEEQHDEEDQGEDDAVMSDDLDDEADGESEDEEYVIERILKERVRQGKREFLVCWKGYDDQTWETEANLADNVALAMWLNEA